MDPRFHPVQAVLARGEVEAMRTLLVEDPALATARSTRSHPTILQCLVLNVPPVDELEALIDLLAANGANLTDPLIAAASGDNVRAIAKLLDLGANIDGNGRWSPLEEAIYWGHKDSLALLLERGAAVQNLRTAAALGDMLKVAACFDAKGDLTPAAGEVASPFEKLPIPESVRRDRDQIMGNALVHAAAWGRVDAVDFLLDRGAPINQIPAGFDFAGTPLHYAALHGRRDMVDHILKKGADPTLRDTKVSTRPEDWAAHGGHPELSEYLRQVRERAAK
jgi:ankyrin repeat protein